MALEQITQGVPRWQPFVPDYIAATVADITGDLATLSGKFIQLPDRSIYFVDSSLNYYQSHDTQGRPVMFQELINMSGNFAYYEKLILQEYGDTVSIFQGAKSVLQFGRNEEIQTTRTTIMTLPPGIYNETYPTENSITHISSASLSDNTQTITIIGHTLSGSNFTKVTQTVILNGQTKVALTTPLARATKAFVSSGSVDLVGPIYIYLDTPIVAGVPTDGTKVILMIAANRNQSEKASDTVSSTEYLIITSVYADYLEQIAGFTNAQIEFRNFGSVFLNNINFECDGTRAVQGFTDTPIIVPPNSDIRLVAKSSAANREVSGGFSAIVATIVS